MRGDVLPRDLGDKPLFHAQEIEDAVEGGCGLIHQLAVPDNEDLLTGEHREDVLELLAVPPEADVVPERGPARGDAALLLPARLDEVADWLKPGRPEMRPVRMGALDRIPDDRDELGVRDQIPDSAHGIGVVHVQRGRLAAQRSVRSGIEERLVVLPLPHVLTVGQRVTGAAPGGWRPVTEEELWLLDLRHVERRMTGEGCVQRRGTRLRRTDHQEVWQCHGASSAGKTPSGHGFRIMSAV